MTFLKALLSERDTFQSKATSIPDEEEYTEKGSLENQFEDKKFFSIARGVQELGKKMELVGLNYSEEDLNKWRGATTSLAAYIKKLQVNRTN